jgi:5-methyltetrahydrofolate--homocysteine methyltransferase
LFFAFLRSEKMQTLVCGKSKQVRIDREGVFTIIGEKINPTGRKKLAAALLEGNMDYVTELATTQINAGADLLDVNVGVPGADEEVLMPRVVKLLADSFDVPFCLDSANPKALAQALPITPGKPLVNSVNGKQESLEAILPLVRERGASVIGLTMDEQGIPKDAEGRVKIAGRILEVAAKMGIPAEDVIIDPLVLTVGAESQAGMVTLEAIDRVRREFGVNINVGASNVSFGLPERDTVNAAFLALTIGAGATCAITDPIKFTRVLRAVDLLHGKDAFAVRYVKYCRAHPLEKT